jgi:hypothetical protein
MAVFQGFEQDFAYISRLLFVIITLLDNSVEEFSTQHLFRDHVIKLSLFEYIIKSDNVLLREFLQNVDLVLERNFIFLRQFRFGNNLNGKGFVALTVGTFLDYRKGSLAKLTTKRKRVQREKLENSKLKNTSSRSILLELCRK